MNNLTIPAIAMAVSIAISGCTNNAGVNSQPTANSGSQERRSDKTNTVNSANPIVNPQRIVALTSLSADIINNLDRRKLIAVTGSRILNNRAEFKDLPRVAEGRTSPNLEKIVALKPDLVIGARGIHDNVLQQLSNNKIATLSTEVTSWESLIELTNNIAKIIDVPARPLQERYEKMLLIPAKIQGKVLVLAGQQPIVSPNSKAWTGSILAKLNIANASAALEGKSPFNGYVILSPEKILTLDPETIIIIEAEPGTAEKLKKEVFWSQLKAVKNNRIHTFDYYGLVNPGSIDAIEKAIDRLKQIAS
jgi:iron complex transport system substrate-binding protein